MQIDAERLAKIMNGPRNAVPEGARWSLEELQDIRWKHLTKQEQSMLIVQAGAVIKFFYRFLTTEDQLRLMASITQPTWFEGVENGKHILDNFPGQHEKMQKEAMKRAEEAIKAMFQCEETSDD